jgi:hypothetical protein
LLSRVRYSSHSVPTENEARSRAASTRALRASFGPKQPQTRKPWKIDPSRSQSALFIPLCGTNLKSSRHIASPCPRAKTGIGSRSCFRIDLLGGKPYHQSQVPRVAFCRGDYKLSTVDHSHSIKSDDAVDELLSGQFFGTRCIGRQVSKRLRALPRQPSEPAQQGHRFHIDEICRRFVALSPFVIVGVQSRITEQIKGCSR